MVSSKVMAGTNTADDVTPNPIKINSQQEDPKKSTSVRYNFTLFNIFGTYSTSKVDSSSATVIEHKETELTSSPRKDL